MIALIYWMFAFGQFDPLAALAILQKPTYLLSIILSLLLMANIAIRMKSDKWLLSVFALFLFGIIMGVFNSIEIVNIFRGLVGYLLLIPIVYIIRMRNLYSFNMAIALRVMCALLIVEWVYYIWFSGNLLFTSIIVPDTKKYPTGFFTEPSFAVLPLILLAIIGQSYTEKMIFFALSVLYSLQFGVETGSVLILVSAVAYLIYPLGITNWRIFSPLSIVSFSTMALIVFVIEFGDVLFMNQSVQNRLTTPVYYLIANDSVWQMIFGHGIGSVIQNYFSVLQSGAAQLNIGLSIEQLRNVGNDIKFNPSVFNYYSRLYYEYGFLGISVFLVFLNRLFDLVYDRASFVLYALSILYLFSNDKPLNLILITLVIYVSIPSCTAKKLR